MGSWPVEPVSVKKWERGDDRVLVVSLNEHVVGIELNGKVAADALSVIEPTLFDFMERSDAVRMFWDAEAVSSYDVEVRESMVKVFRQYRKRWKSIDVLFASALIGLTVTGVGLAYGGAIKGHRDRASFMRRVEQALAETSR